MKDTRWENKKDNNAICGTGKPLIPVKTWMFWWGLVTSGSTAFSKFF